MPLLPTTGLCAAFECGPEVKPMRAGNCSSVISLEKVTYTYPGAPAPALIEVSLKISPGERLAVIGSSGSGKSTLARLIAGLIEPESGRIARAGPRPGAKDVAIVFQNPETQLIAETVEEDVAIGPENLGLPSEEIRRRVESALEILDIAHLAKRSVASLSGGEKQRVAVAGALALQPSCLVLDEASAMLHPSAKRQLEAVVARLQARSIAVVQITHDMNEAARADRLLLLHQGRVVCAGSPAEILTEASLLARCGLEPPEPVQIALALRRHGLHLARIPLDLPSLADAVAKELTP